MRAQWPINESVNVKLYLMFGKKKKEERKKVIFFKLILFFFCLHRDIYFLPALGSP